MASTQHQPPPRKRAKSNPDSGSSGDLDITDYKAELWRMADALRGSGKVRRQFAPGESSLEEGK